MRTSESEESDWSAPGPGATRIAVRPRWHVLVLGWVLLLAAAGLRAQTACDSTQLAQLPIIERPALSDTNATLVLLLTGDGGWAGADEKVSDGLRAMGAAVVGLNMRSYLHDKKTPDQVAADVGCLAETFSQRWHRNRLLLLGYSRGADIVPFVASRWPSALRDRLNMVAMVSLSKTANFKFHLIDLVRNVSRDDDVPVAPEIAKLKGLHLVCIYGTEESDSGCLGLDPQLVQSYARSGGHRLTEGFQGIASILQSGLRAPA